MTTLSEGDRRFMERRRGHKHVGLYLLPSSLALVLALWIALYFWWPLAVNPLYASVYYEGTLIEPGTITNYAIAVAVLVNALLLTFSIALVFGLLWARSERRYLKLLLRLAPPAAHAPKPETSAS